MSGQRKGARAATARRPRAGALVAATALLAALLAWAWGADARADDEDAVREAVAEDPVVQAAAEAVEEAERRREEAADEAARAEAVVEVLRAELDAAVATYEAARAHHSRLEEEREDQEAKVAEALEASDDAREGLARHVADLYKQAPLELRLSDLVLQAEGPNVALHRVGLIGQVGEAGRRRVADFDGRTARAADEARQHEVVTVGAAGSAAHLEEARAEVEETLAAYRDELAAAERGLAAADERLAAAEDDEDAERERAREQAERLAALEARMGEMDVDVDAARLPPVDGMVCPIGAPHSFVDTWGAPRPGGRQHRGVDIFAEYGMPLYAVADGEVSVSTNRLGGLVVNLHSDDGDRYYYAHLSATAVDTGQRVEAGDVVGANGDSGNARGTPPHLHWQYHPGGGGAVNPTPLADLLCRS